jgi:hypothetical protein
MLWHTAKALFVVLVNSYLVAKAAVRLFETSRTDLLAPCRSSAVSRSAIRLVLAGASLWLGGIVLLAPAMLLVDDWIGLYLHLDWGKWLLLVTLGVPGLVFTVMFDLIAKRREKGIAAIWRTLLSSTPEGATFSELCKASHRRTHWVYRTLMAMHKDDVVSFDRGGRRWRPNRRFVQNRPYS